MEIMILVGIAYWYLLFVKIYECVYTEREECLGITKKATGFASLSRCIALDCETVGIGEDNSAHNFVTRVSIVNSEGKCIYDKYVKRWGNYSGTSPYKLENCDYFRTIQTEVASIIKNNILIGYDLFRYFQALPILSEHPTKYMRDIANGFTRFKKKDIYKLRSLKEIANDFLGIPIQDDEHNSLEYARIAMNLYMNYCIEWEKERLELLQKEAKLSQHNSNFNIVRTARLTKCVALDCEVIGYNASIIARVSIVNSERKCIYDKYVKHWSNDSGTSPYKLLNRNYFHTIQTEVASIIKNNILIGYDLFRYFQALPILSKHPTKYMRDIANGFTRFKNKDTNKLRSLKDIANDFLGIPIQDDSLHNSLEVARIAMNLYMKYCIEWEKERLEGLTKQKEENFSTHNPNFTTVGTAGHTKCVALDCEMVGIYNESIVARVSMVNSFGICLYDKYVKPTVNVTNYRTNVSGIRPNDLVNGEDFLTVQSEVAAILKDRILIGHALYNDFQVLPILRKHPRNHIRDTYMFKKFRNITNNMPRSLKDLAKDFLDIAIQNGEHSSVEDARVAMKLYMTYRSEWEMQRRVFFAQNTRLGIRQPSYRVTGKKVPIWATRGAMLRQYTAHVVAQEHDTVQGN